MSGKIIKTFYLVNQKEVNMKSLREQLQKDFSENGEKNEALISLLISNDAEFKKYLQKV